MARRTILIYLLFFSMTACFGGASEEVPDEGLTYHKDIRPLLNAHCNRCHFENGTGLGDFTDYQNVKI